VLSKKEKLIIYTSILISGFADILNPAVQKKISSWCFWKRRRIHKTSNSFCDTDIFKPLPLSEKKNWIVFLGRFSSIKQVKELLIAIPLIHAELKARFHAGFHFFILGHGEMESELLDIKQGPAFKDIPIDIQYQKDPQRILNQSKVFLSLQLHNNYPSRSLLEAMASGNIPLVTDNGETRMLARPEFSYYVPEKFTAEQIADQLIKIFALTDEEFLTKTKMARQTVIDNHTMDKMKDYYLTVYQSMCSKHK
jgi:glycosyltransferase involved in cell wall biosynthesis